MNMEKFRINDSILQGMMTNSFMNIIGKLEGATMMMVDFVLINAEHELYFRRERELKHEGRMGTMMMDCPFSDMNDCVCNTGCPFLSIGTVGEDKLCLVLSCIANARVIIADNYCDERERIPNVGSNVRRVEKLSPTFNEEDNGAA